MIEIPRTISLLLVAASAAAQADAPELPAEAPAGVALIGRGELLAHAQFLAADELGGRLTGSDGQIRAAAYIRDHFKKLGLKPLGDRKGRKPDWYQRYAVELTSVDARRSSLEIGKVAVKEQWGMFAPSGPLKLSARAKFAFVDPANPRIGRNIPVVMLDPPAGRGSAQQQHAAALRPLQRITGATRKLAGAGARAVVFLTTSDHAGLLSNLNTGGLGPGKPLLKFGSSGPRGRQSVKIPAIVVSAAKSVEILQAMGVSSDEAGAASAADLARKAKALSGTLKLLVTVDKKARASNVVAVLRGSDKRLASEAIVYSAHMDHVGRRADGDVFNGADDNASGTAGLLTIATAFAKAKVKPKRSIVFLAVSGEELGLWGSAWYADHPTWPLGRIVADINTDMIGRSGPESGPNQVTVTPSFRHAEFSTIVRDAAAIGRTLGIEFTNGDKYYQRSDHYNFARKGVPVVFFCDGEHEDYHRVTDHADKLDGAKMEKIARLAFWTGWRVANASERPRKLGRQSGW